MELGGFKLVAGAESMASSDELRRKKRDQNKDNEVKLSDDESCSNPVSSSNPEPDQGPGSAGEVDQRPSYGMTSVCGRRRDMEDAVSIRPDFLNVSRKHHFFGVFDGHGCSHVRYFYFILI